MRSRIDKTDVQRFQEKIRKAYEAGATELRPMVESFPEGYDPEDPDTYEEEDSDDE